MDTSDPGINFSNEGICDYCLNFDSNIGPIWKDSFGAAGRARLMALASQIKADRSPGASFDCIIGLSGGLDSSYAALVAIRDMGLRPLLVHVAAGWNTDQAVGNIEKLVDGLGAELYTDVGRWSSIKRMQLAFFKSGIADLDLVQDAVFFSSLYRFARIHKIKHVLTGSNFSTECCREPEAWGGFLGIDKTLFDDIWRKCGDGEPIEFPIVDILKYKIFYQKMLSIKVHHPLNYVPFVKSDAEDKLKNEFSWMPFKHKHHESRFTRFYEDYWLPKRFGFDKRKAHFSSLICTGQLSREAALRRLQHPEMPREFMAREVKYIAHKLGVSVEELDVMMNAPRRTFLNYRSKRSVIRGASRLLRFLGVERRYFR